MYDLNYLFDDHQLCDQQGLQYRLAAPKETEPEIESQFVVYPNPSSNNITIDLNGDWEGTFSLKIISLTGITIKLYNNVSNKHTINLKPLNINQGIYLIELTHLASSQTFRTRFVYGN